MSNGNYNMKPGSKQTDTEGTFNQKQTDTIGKLTPKPKLSRKQKKFNEAKAQKFQNYIKESKQDFPSFDQKKDTVVSTTGHTLGPLTRARHSHATRRVDFGFPNLQNPPEQKIFRNRKTGDITMKTKIRKLKK